MTQPREWDAARYQRDGQFVSDYGSIILDWLDPQANEHILDFGCGEGALTEKIAARGAVVTGLDASENMVKAARQRGLYVKQMDGLALDEEAVYDAVFSNAVLHWIEDWDRLFVVVKRALKENGRFVAECGGHGNIAAIRTAIMAAAAHYNVETKAAAEQYLTPEQAEERLSRAGFQVERIELQPRRTVLVHGMKRWLKLFRPQFFAQFQDEEMREDAMQRILTWLQPQLRINAANNAESGELDGQWVADYVRLRFIAESV